MKKILFKVYTNINSFNVIFLNILCLVSALLISLSIYIHPLVGDDYLYKEMVLQNDINFINYFFSRYHDWSGRIYQNFITYYLYSSDLFINFYKLLIYPSYLLICYLIFFKIANSQGKKNYTEFLIFLILFWFAIPVPSETIVWVIGTTVYIYPLLFATLFLSYLTKQRNLFKKKAKFLLIVLFAFLAGSSQLQLLIACFVISIFSIITLFKKNNLNKTFFSNLIPFIFFFLGVIIFFISPGNYARLSSIEDLSLFSQLYKSFIFIISSYFYLGNINSFLILFLSLIVFRYLFTNKLKFKNFYNLDTLPWLLASIASMIINVLVINFVSFRTLFFPIIFFVIYILKVIKLYQEHSDNNKFKSKLIILYFLMFSLLLDSFFNLVTTYNYSLESKARESLIQTNIQNSIDIISVPYFETIPSRLTYIQNPQHDYEFIQSYTKKYDAKFIHSDNKPMSKNIYKQIKFFFRKNK